MTREVRLGKLGIGGNNPIRIKGMLKASISDEKSLIKEAKKLEKEGVEAIRIAVKDKGDAKIAKVLKKHISLPLMADIHFHYLRALEAIDEGFEGVRLNPMNIDKKKEVREIARKAKSQSVAIRVGINSGGFKRDFSSPEKLAGKMVKKVQDYLELLESENFFDIMVSLKGSDIFTTILANRAFSKKYDYPLHLGITATGSFVEGIVKSSIGIGQLIGEGIGSAIRVSLTAASFWEIRVAKHILQALELRKFGPEVISCPTCSRCDVDLIALVDKFKRDLKKSGFNKPLKIALMGCVVNGPGEAYQADIGVAFGKKKAAIFKKDKILKYSEEKDVVSDLITEVRRLWT